MKIALFGYGKMGTLIEQIALAQGHSIIARFSRNIENLENIITLLNDADIAIDFSTPSAVMTHLSLCLSADLPILIGTTGWDQEITKAKEIVAKANGKCFFSPNFSIGIYLFHSLIDYAATLFQPFEEYGVHGVECHHEGKIDKPSGTAKLFSQLIMKRMPRMKNFEFSSIRRPDVPGIHTLHFDSPIDTITMTHEAHNRNGFAQGALQAAQWLLQAPQGFFSMEDMMNEPCKSDVAEHS